MKKFLFLILILCCFVFSFSAYWFGSLLTYLTNNSGEQEQGPIRTVIIKKGMSARTIASELYKYKIISHPEYFILGWRIKYHERPFQAGEYVFKENSRPLDVMAKLIEGDVVLHSVTIPEGLRLNQIQEVILEKLRIDRSSLDKALQNVQPLYENGIQTTTLEGFLYPDTYFFPESVTPDTIVLTMINRFFSIFTQKYQARATELGFSIIEIVTLASLIEKEVAVASERTIISAVYHNRLKKRMRLQCDPTVIYALPGFNGNLTKKDLEFDSPYNTYRYSGLPPGPICSPGKESLAAALYPAEVPYLYFVAKGNRSGEHIFSKTLKEHNQAVYQEQIIERRKYRNTMKK